jgi:hypothetical protein
VKRWRSVAREEEFDQCKAPLASPGTLIVARVPRNQSCSPSPEPDQVAAALTRWLWRCSGELVEASSDP